jgi:hypothetical protein
MYLFIYHTTRRNMQKHQNLNNQSCGKFIPEVLPAILVAGITDVLRQETTFSATFPICRHIY